MAAQARRKGPPQERVNAWAAYKDEVKDKAMEIFPQIFEELTGATMIPRGGNQFMCKCPFHADKSPSMMVNAIGYNCQGAGCPAKGDVFKLVLDLKFCNTFQESIDFVASRIGVDKPAILGGSAAPRQYKKVEIKEKVEQDPFLAYPSLLQPCDLIPVPKIFPLPVPGQPISIWREDRSDARFPKKEGMFRYTPEMVHIYRGVDGVPKLVIMRIQPEAGKKLFIPLRVGKPWKTVPGGFIYDKEHTWLAQASSGGHRRPIYGLEDLQEWIENPNRGPIIVVEGEKCRDKMVERCGKRGALILSALGGGESVKYMDWTPIVKAIAEAGIEDVRLMVWPDADDNKVVEISGRTEIHDPQEKFSRTVACGFLRDLRDARKEVGFESEKDSDGVDFTRITPPDDVISGWDVADATEEGWSGNEIALFMKNNQKGIDMSNMAGKKVGEIPDPEISSGSDLEVTPRPFELATSDGEPASGLSEGEKVFSFGSDFESMISELDDAQAGAFDLSNDDSDIPDDDDEDAVDGDSDGDNGVTSTARGRELVRNNEFFRCLGIEANGTMFFMNMKSAVIFDITTSKLNKNFMIRLAELPFWMKAAPVRDDTGRPIGVNWDLATDYLFREIEAAGFWNGRKQVRQGAKMDKGRVVFHTGQKLWIEGLGVESIQGQNAHHLEYLYTTSSDYPMPDMENPFPAESQDVRQFLNILKSLDWRKEGRNRAVMALFGYLTISPICGILKWRPHIWLDGSRGAGKTWVMQNIVNPVLGDYREMVKSNSTESGIRNILNARAIPVIFDEAEGSSQRDKARLDEIISLVRHTSSESDSIVAQGVSGGGSSKSYEVSSMFFLASITTRIDAPADKTRFARISLGSGLRGDDFVKSVELPARDLLTKQFASRLIARMITRAKDAQAVIDMMVRTLMMHNMERRIADLYGVFAAGAWLALRDDIPESEAEVAAFIEAEFGAVEDLIEINEELTIDRDHERVISGIMGCQKKIDTSNGTQLTESISVLMRIACNINEDDSLVSITQAFKTLSDFGIKPGFNGVQVDPEEDVNCFIIHKSSPEIKKALKDTPYETGYADILRHAPGTYLSKTMRFRSLKNDRGVVVPMEMFGIKDVLEDENEGDAL